MSATASAKKRGRGPKQILSALELATALDVTAPAATQTEVAAYTEQLPDGLTPNGTVSEASRLSTTLYSRVYEELGIRYRQFRSIGPGSAGTARDVGPCAAARDDLHLGRDVWRRTRRRSSWW